MSRALRSPGILGTHRLMAGRPYAERDGRAAAWHDRAAAVVLSAGRKVLRRPVNLRAIVAETNRHDAKLRHLTDSDLMRMAADLRPRLRRDGLLLPVVAECFALIREAGARSIGRRHYDSQVMAGWALIQGNLLEMATGEGKTVAATLAAATVAMAGLPVHVVTVNDYLAERDATEMAPLYAALGLTTGHVVLGMESPARRAAYRCSVTYCSNKELAFDYLRDRLAIGGRGSRLHMAVDQLCGDQAKQIDLVLHGLHFAIVDEADSVFIDEARTPLVLSATVGNEGENVIYLRALEIARALLPGQDYVLGRASHTVALTRAGRDRMTGLDPIETSVWGFPRAREEMVGQALTALHLLRRDHDYVVTNDIVQIVDISTGRVMDGRSWEAGLHQLVELKEGCPTTGRRETLARLTYQRLFRRFIRLSGMTGTAREVATEIRGIYGLDVVRIPLHRLSQRRRGMVRFCATRAQKWQAVADRVAEVAIAGGRPVLVGTRSVVASEEVAAALTARGITHALLNAKQDREEAEIVAQAGQHARVTVATNMAGRGTDILLGDGVARDGGLHVILTEYHDSHRVDRQLFGRCARQGDPGSFDVIASLEDEVYADHAPRLVACVRRLTSMGVRVPGLLSLLTHLAQSACERQGRGIRVRSLRHDEHMDRFLAFSGRPD